MGSESGLMLENIPVFLEETIKSAVMLITGEAAANPAVSESLSLFGSWKRKTVSQAE